MSALAPIAATANVVIAAAETAAKTSMVDAASVLALTALCCCGRQPPFARAKPTGILQRASAANAEVCGVDVDAGAFADTFRAAPDTFKGNLYRYTRTLQVGQRMLVDGGRWW